MNPNITVQEVKSLTKPTDGYLCSLDANTYGIQFVYFKIRNINETKQSQTLFQIRKEEKDWGKPVQQEGRTVRYHFGPLFFHLKTIGTTLQFKVGDKPVKKFLMIERHYFKNELIKSYEFEVPFCIPNTQNSLQAIYELPVFTQEKVKEMINSPWQTKSDSFYFVEGKLVMHNKAQFNYAPF